MQNSPLPPGRRLVKLDAAFLALSQGEAGLGVHALTMVNQDLVCLNQQPTALGPLETCLREAAQKNLEGLVENFGEPGAGGPLDLALIDRDTPRVHYVARFNDLGKYYRMPHAPGLPPGRYRNPGISAPLYPAINYPVLNRNGVISSALFGKPAFGDYRRP